ncbi:MAG: peptidoglycan-binding domain-containing protein [Pyrinomonadaceae bacterium]
MYMAQSMIAQGKAIVQHWDRGKAYDYDSNNYQKWSDYNVEQQGNIVEDWFAPKKGNQSVSDPRYTYIEKVIRTGNRNAYDIPSAGAQAGAITGKKGYDPLIFEVQNLLNRYGYRIRPDGFYGNQTIAAIKDFQRKHHLKDDGIPGQNTLVRLRGR